MKTECNNCGLHFEDEFEQTLVKGCTFWYQNDLEMLSEDDKRAIWEWYFSNPCDRILVEYDVALYTGGFPRGIRNMSMRTQLLKDKPGYEEMSEEEQRDHQRGLKLERASGVKSS